MGDLAKFLREIRQRPEVKNQFFDAKFLNNVGCVLERRGFEEARLFVWDSHFRGDLEKQAVTVLGILGEMEKVEPLKKNLAIGGHLIKNIGKVSR
jgi:hypothetical protein